MKIVFASVVIIASSMAASFAQQPTADQMDLAYNSARNQVGVLAYCQENGYIDDSAGEVQAKLIALIPAPADTSKGDEAEALGRSGKVSAMGMEQDLVEAAKAQGTEVGKLCEVMATALKQAGASLPQ